MECYIDCGQGFIANSLGWRWNFYILSALSFPVAIGILFMLPETLDPNGPKRSPNPFIPLAMLRHPRIGSLSLLNGFIFSAMYAMIYEFPIVLEKEYDLNASEIGLSYIPFGVLLITGSLLGGKPSDKAAKKWGRGGRLVPTVAGSAMASVGIMGFGWTINSSFAIGLLFSAILGFCLTFQRPGLQAFCFEEKPGQTSTVAASMMLVQFILV
jgi:predicted MFS family arabinose efflux permease